MDQVQAYIEAVARGEGFLPWQSRERVSDRERVFREQIEARKDDLLSGATRVQHPAMLSSDSIARARATIEQADWARDYFEGEVELADHAVAGGDAWVDHMLPLLTPMCGYGFTCPNCVGVHSQEGAGSWRMLDWDYKQPDLLICKACGQTYPDARFPESARLECPRTGQTFTWYPNDRERADPDNRTGELAWKWVGQPMQISFEGIIRENKARFMLGAVARIAKVYAITGETQYARATIAILKRLARCYRQWLYHDYFGCFADCDPMFAAWHDMAMPLEFKRHPNTSVYRGRPTESGKTEDTLDEARMLARYFGAGRVHPSTDVVTLVYEICLAYDLTFHAADENGTPLWSDGDRVLVERDLILEYVMTGEPSLGGPGKTDDVCNKAPRMYLALAATARCLGVVDFADTALRGFEAIRDHAFNFDGFSHESPAYTEMFLNVLLRVTEALHGFDWPDGHATRTGTIDLYTSDPKLRLMMRAGRDDLCLDGRYIPLSDTLVDNAPSPGSFEIGVARLPEYFSGTRPALRRARDGVERPTPFALFELDQHATNDDAGITHDTLLFPAWKTAVLRGTSPNSPHDVATLAMPFNPSGGHRHNDNLTLYYDDAGQRILGDLGYIGDTPMNTWFHTSASHNLVVVDGEEQFGGNYRRGGPGRHTDLRWMFETPWVTGVEASSKAYASCSDYRRAVVLIRSPHDDGRTFAVDLFRVSGGRQHTWQVFSEVGASDADGHALTFDGVALNAHRDLPNFGRSTEREHIFGLRDAISCDSVPDGWTATWQQLNRAYRLHMLSPCDRVTTAHGPGQETIDNPGRRVRYVQASREGDNLSSAFVAVHEPSNVDSSWVIERVERLNVPDAGPNTVALRIVSAWGDYLVLSDFEREAIVAGVRFVGQLGIVHRTLEGATRITTCGAATCQTADGKGFADVTPRWIGNAARVDGHTLHTDAPRPDDWPAAHGGIFSYANVDFEGTTTGHRIDVSDATSMTSQRFPFDEPTMFDVPIVRVSD